MSEVTEEQFQAAVAAAIAGVEHLYREVDLLIARLREDWLTDQNRSRSSVARSARPGRGLEARRRPLSIRWLFEPAIDDEEEDEDDELEEDDADEDRT